MLDTYYESLMLHKPSGIVLSNLQFYVSIDCIASLQ
jgi:hypothetical protein